MNPYREMIYKEAKSYPKFLPDGSYATPRGWMPGGEYEDEEYYRDEHKIPKHLKLIADNGWGDSTFVDTRNKKNPTYYDWDHETTELTKHSPKKVEEMFSTEDRYKDSFDKLKSMGLNKRKDIDSITDDQLKELGYDIAKLNHEEKVKLLKKNIKSNAKGAGYGAFGGFMLAGHLSQNVTDTPRYFKRLGKGMLAGAGVGLGLSALLNRGETIDNHKRELDEFKDRLIYSIYDDEDNKEFINQYKTATYKQAGFEDGPPPPYTSKGSKRKVLIGTTLGAAVGGLLGKSMFPSHSTVGRVGMGLLGAGIGSIGGLAYYNHTKLAPEKQRLNDMINEHRGHSKQISNITNNLPDAALRQNLQENMDELAYLEQHPESYIDGQPTKELRDSRSIVNHTIKELAELQRQTNPYVQKDLKEIEDRNREKERLREVISKQREWLRPQLMFRNPRDI